MRGEAIRVIALNTYRESVRSKVLYAFFFFAIVMVIITSIFSTSTIGDHIIMLKDFGLFIISLASVGFVVVAGSSLLAKELQRKTVFNILAKPVHRSEFLIGKFLGMAATGSALVLLMSAGLFALLWILEGQADPLLFVAVFFILLELLIVSACAIFFSSIVVTPMLTGMFTFGTFLAGRSIRYLSGFADDVEMPLLLRSAARVLSHLLPNLDTLYVANYTVYGVGVSGGFLWYAVLYTGGYLVTLLALSSLLFRRRNFV